MSYSNGTMSRNIAIPSPSKNVLTMSAASDSGSVAVSVSPTTSTSLHSLLRKNSLPAPAASVRPPRVLRPFATGELRLLLLENISQGAVEHLTSQGFQVDWYPKAWSEDELVQKIGQYHAIGIRSKTKITEKVLKAASKVGLTFSFTRLL
jgi:D-3-phosphoglycerate dehydrogenase / 2-oxoglutarate reductase